MSTPHEWLAGEAGWWWPSVADHLWQASLFGLIVLAASLALQRGPARLRHSLWLLASAKFMVPAGLFVFMAELTGIDSSWFSQPAPGSQQNALLLQGLTGPVSAIANSYELTVVATDVLRHNEIYCALSLIWLGGTLTFLGVWAMRRRKFLRALKDGGAINRAARGREWQALERAKEFLHMKTEVELVISSHKTEPAVCRVWKPVVLMPQDIADHLDDAELEAIMLHELIHIQRRDNLIGTLQMIVCALLWFHPLVWFINSKLFDERELACDEEVLKIHGSPHAYAASILKVVRFSIGWRVAGVTGAGSGSNLRRRIENIMTTNNTRRSTTGWHRLLAGTLLGFALVLMVVAGVYTRSRNANAAVSLPPVHETSVGPVAQRESMAPAAQSDSKGSKTQGVEQPPAPPQPPQPAPPAQPSHPAQPAQAPQPPPQNQLDPVVAPAAPTAASASTPPTPPVAPTPPTQGKSQSKNKVKEKGPKDKVEKGGLIEAPHPVYPPEAKDQKVEGTVAVAIVIGEEGNVISATPRSGPEILHGAAREAALKARFRPTLVDGKPAKVAGTLSYTFVAKK